MKALVTCQVFKYLIESWLDVGTGSSSFESALKVSNYGSVSCSPRVSSVLQGVCRAVKEYFSSPVKVARLWMHECERVFQDRMINPADATRFSEMLEHARKKNFEDLDSDALAVRPLIFTAFTSQTPDGQPVYTNVDDYHKLKVGTRIVALLDH
jgi:hypothetical protein